MYTNKNHPFTTAFHPILIRSIKPFGVTIFSDNFSGDTTGLAKTTLVNWNVLNSTNLDIGAFCALCTAGGGMCMDSQGSGGNPSSDIETKSLFALGAGNYNFHFTLNNATASTVLLTIGTFSQLLGSGTTATNGTYELAFTFTVQNARIRLTDQGPADNVGLYLGNFELSSTSGVPEPSSFLLVVAGLGAAGLLHRRKRA